MNDFKRNHAYLGIDGIFHAEEHARHAGQEPAQREYRGHYPIGIDAHEGGGLDIVRSRPYGLARAGKLYEGDEAA
jgi:hypothetical protein